MICGRPCVFTYGRLISFQEDRAVHVISLIYFFWFNYIKFKFYIIEGSENGYFFRFYIVFYILRKTVSLETQEQFSCYIFTWSIRQSVCSSLITTVSIHSFFALTCYYFRTYITPIDFFVEKMLAYTPSMRMFPRREFFSDFMFTIDFSAKKRYHI